MIELSLVHKRVSQTRPGNSAGLVTASYVRGHQWLAGVSDIHERVSKVGLEDNLIVDAIASRKREEG